MAYNLLDRLIGVSLSTEAANIVALQQELKKAEQRVRQLKNLLLTRWLQQLERGAWAT